MTNEQAEQIIELLQKIEYEVNKMSHEVKGIKENTRDLEEIKYIVNRLARE